MGANQSTARHSEAGPLRTFTCCCHTTGRDDFVEAPERHLQLSQGQVQPTKTRSKSPFRSPLATTQPLTPSQPAMRSNMSLPLSSRVATPEDEFAQRHGAIDSGAVRPSSRARALSKKLGVKTSITFAESSLQPPLLDHERSPHVEAPKLELPLLGLGVGDMLPQQNKRLSSMPDFTSLQSQEMKKIAAAEPWLVVRSIAEKTPSRRSNVFEQNLSPRANDSKLMASWGLNSPPKSPPTSPPRTATRRRAQTSVERKRPEYTDESILSINFDFGQSNDHHRGPSAPLRLQTDFGDDTRPQPTLMSDSHLVNASDIRKGSASSSHSGSSVHRKRSKMARIRKDSAPAKVGDTCVEDAVRELEQIVQAKRDPETPGSAISPTTRNDNKPHRPAIAPKMVMKDVSSELLDDIGSGLSRRLSDETSSPFNNELANSTTSSLPLSTISKHRLSRRESSWPGTTTISDGCTPRHSGTFFFSRKSLDEIISPQSSANIVSSLRKLDRSSESPIDRQWPENKISKAQLAGSQAQSQRVRKTSPTMKNKPLPAKPPPKSSHSTRMQAQHRQSTPHEPFTSYHRPNVSSTSQATTTTNFSINSNLFAATPDSGTPSMPQVQNSERFPKPPGQPVQTSSSPPRASNTTPTSRRPSEASDDTMRTSINGRKLSNADRNVPPTSHGERRPSHHSMTNPSQPQRDRLPSSSQAATAAHPQPHRAPSRTDTSAAVINARKLAAARVAKEEAKGMGLAIGGMLSASDMADVVAMDVWDAKPAHEHPSRSRAASGATHKTDSVLVEPSMSPAAASDGVSGLYEGVEQAMSVQVPKRHMAQLVRTPSGKSVKTSATRSRQGSVEQPKKKKARDADGQHRPLAGAPRKASKESNTLPGTSAPAQNEARQRKQSPEQYLHYPQLSRQRSEEQQLPHPVQSTSRVYHRAAVPPKASQPTGTNRQGAASPRNRSGSGAGRHQGVEFGLDLQRSASARRLREVEARIAAMEKEREQEAAKMPSPTQQLTSPVGEGAASLSGSYGQGRNVRASQVGMAF